MTAHVIGRVEEAAARRDLNEAMREFNGVYHAAGAGETTWHGFAVEAVRREHERQPRVRLAEVDAISTAEYPTPARRPANSRLNCGKLAATFAWKMMDWRGSLLEVMKEL
jgi:dTDP-4-dehydrorhamnose reductase